MGVRKSNTLLKATTAIALMSGALGSNNYEMKQQNNKLNTRRARNKNNSRPHHHHNGMAGFVADNSNNKKNRRDLTEDIDFFTRMTQATGSIPMPRPTPFPVAASVPPAPALKERLQRVLRLAFGTWGTGRARARSLCKGRRGHKAEPCDSSDSGDTIE